jgi:hypothetical protein
LKSSVLSRRLTTERLEKKPHKISTKDLVNISAESFKTAQVLTGGVTERTEHTGAVKIEDLKTATIEELNAELLNREEHEYKRKS